MMPKSTATSRPSRVHEQIAGMHVGMEKAVAQRLGEESCAPESARPSWDHGPPPRSAVGIADRRAVDPFAGQHAGPRCASSPHAARGIRRRRGCARKARTPPPLPCADPVPAPPRPPGSRTSAIKRSRRASAERRSRHAREQAPERRRSRANCASMPGRSTFTATRPRLRWWRPDAPGRWRRPRPARRSTRTSSPPAGRRLCAITWRARRLPGKAAAGPADVPARAATSSPTISGRVASIWPSLI